MSDLLWSEKTYTVDPDVHDFIILKEELKLIIGLPRQVNILSTLKSLIEYRCITC